MQILLFQVIPSLILSAFLVAGFSIAKVQLLRLSDRLSRRNRA